MSLDFKVCKIGDLGNIFSGGTPSTKIKEYWDGNLNWLSSGETRNTYIYRTEKFITKEGADNSSTKLANKGDIVIASAGQGFTRGQSSMVMIDTYVNQSVIVIHPNDKVNNFYLLYNLKFRYPELRQLSDHASTRGSLTTKIIKDLDINLPDLNTQNKIANIIQYFDKKIETNKKINRNLTELSHVLHKEFIKSIDNNGFCYYKEVKELGTIIMGQSPKGESYNYDNIGLPLINGAADYENGYLKAQKYTTDPKKTCDKNDLIFCIRATIGLLVICDKEYCLGRGVAGITNIDTLYKEYAFHLINSSIENFKRTATGSVISGISRKDIEEIPVRILTKDDMKKYHTIQKPIFDKLENNRIEIDNLIKLRDTLLPRLMSGEIDVSKINCDILQTSRKNCDNKFTLTLQNNLIEVIS